MGTIMIRCPRTGRAIATGIAADHETFRCSPVFFGRTRCSICQTNHEWFSGEAWIHDPSETDRSAAGSAMRWPADPRPGRDNDTTLIRGEV